jgi:hypothetical protein
MSINSNRPLLSPSPGFKQSMSDMGKVTHTAIEAVTDLFHDANGHITEFKEVKEAFQELSTKEKIVFSAGGAIIGGAMTSLSLVDNAVDTVADKAQEVGKAVEKQVEKKYKSPPEAKIVESVKNVFEDIVDGAEAFIDDVKDGRIARDVTKNVKRFHRDHFTEQGPLDKIKNKIGDAAEDAVHAASDLVDDIADGRTGHQIEKKVKRTFD